MKMPSKMSINAKTRYSADGILKGSFLLLQNENNAIEFNKDTLTGRCKGHTLPTSTGCICSKRAETIKCFNYEPPSIDVRTVIR